MSNLKLVSIVARDLPDAWFQAVDAVLEHGRKWTVERGSYVGQQRWELDWIQIHVTHPHQGDLTPTMPPHLSHIPPPTTMEYVEEYLPYLMEDMPLKKNEQYCYDPETEVLTEVGWKDFPTLSYADKVATLNPYTKALEYHHPQLIVEFKNTKPMFHWRSSQVDHLVTQGHNVFVASENSVNFSHRKVQSVQDRRFRVKRDCLWEGRQENSFSVPGVEYKNTRYKGWGEEKEFPITQWLRFFGYWLADGSLRSQGCNYAAVITKQNNEERRRILGEVKELFPTAFEYGKDILISNKQLVSYLSRFGKAGDKYIPGNLLHLSSPLLEILLQAMYSCDGSKVKDGSKLFRYSTKSKLLADQVQEVCLKTGRAANISYDSNIYRVNIAEAETFRMPHLLQRRNCENIGVRAVPVFCAQVPNHTLYVRRNGKAMWSGNTYGQRVRPQMDRIVERYKKGFGSNQECITIARPEDIDLPDPPCWRSLDTRIFRDGNELHFFPYFRSWDLWNGFPANMAAIALMQQYMAEMIGVEPGEIICTSKGLHLYDHAWDIAKLRVGYADNE